MNMMPKKKTKKKSRAGVAPCDVHHESPASGLAGGNSVNDANHPALVTSKIHPRSPKPCK